MSTYNGKECSKGHGTLRYSANGTCVVCNRDKTKHVKERKKEDVGLRYFGAVCAKHPELNGERLTSSSTCVLCHRERSNARQKKNGYPVMKRKTEKNRNAVFDHYGRQCQICGESDEDVLTIDHVNQDGNKHTSASGSRYKGTHLYAWLVKNGLPEGFRTLCANCNLKAYKVFKRTGELLGVK